VLSGVRLSRALLPEHEASASWGSISVSISRRVSALQIPAEMNPIGNDQDRQLAVSRGWRRPIWCTNVTVNCVLPGPTAFGRSRNVPIAMAAERKTDRSTLESEFFRSVRRLHCCSASKPPRRSHLWSLSCAAAIVGHQWRGLRGRVACEGDPGRHSPIWSTTAVECVILSAAVARGPPKNASDLNAAIRL